MGAVSALGLPGGTAWFAIDATSPLSGFELFGATDGGMLGAYAGNGAGARAGIFPKIEKSGWTGISFINTEADAAAVALTVYDDNGGVVATQIVPINGHGKVVHNPQSVFTQEIAGATYIAYSSDRNVLGFQLNGSSDGTMLDGLPGL